MIEVFGRERTLLGAVFEYPLLSYILETKMLAELCKIFGLDHFDIVKNRHSKKL